MFVKAPKPLYEWIIDATCIYYDITREELFTKRAPQHTIDKKQVCFYVMKKMTDMRDSAMARVTGHGRTTIQSALEKVDGQKDIYRQLNDEIKDIMAIADKLYKNQKEPWLKPLQVSN